MYCLIHHFHSYLSEREATEVFQCMFGFSSVKDQWKSGLLNFSILRFPSLGKLRLHEFSPNGTVLL